MARFRLFGRSANAADLPPAGWHPHYPAPGVGWALPPGRGPVGEIDPPTDPHGFPAITAAHIGGWSEPTAGSTGAPLGRPVGHPLTPGAGPAGPGGTAAGGAGAGVRLGGPVAAELGAASAVGAWPAVATSGGMASDVASWAVRGPGTDARADQPWTSNGAAASRPAAAPDPYASGQSPALRPDPAEAGALAGAFAVDYLSWDEDDPGRRGRVLRDYLRQPAGDPALLGWSGEGRQRAEFALPGLVRADGEGRVLVDVRVRVTPYRSVGDRTPDPAATAEPEDGLAGVPAVAPAPTGRGWRSLASCWIRLSVPVAHEGGRLVVDAWEETLGLDEPGAEPGAGPAAVPAPADHVLVDDDPLAGDAS